MVRNLNEKHEGEYVHLVKTYFCFMYYLGATPVRFVYDSRRGRYYAEDWLPQKILSAVTNIFGIVVLVSGLREQLPTSNVELIKNPKPYFDSLFGICFFMYKLAVMKLLWCNWDKYLRVLNLLTREKDLPAVKGGLVLRLLLAPGFSLLLYGVILLELIACIAGGFSFVHPVWRWTPSWYLRRLVGFSRFVFFMAAPANADQAPEWNEISVWDWIISGITFMGEIRRGILALYADICILAVTLTLWVIVKSFANDITDMLQNDELEIECQEEEEDEQWNAAVKCEEKREQLLDAAKLWTSKITTPIVDANRQRPWPRFYCTFCAIRNLSSYMNQALGSHVTWYMAEGLMYYSSQLNNIIFTDDPLVWVATVMFYTFTFFILYLSADICFQVGNVKAWLLTRNNLKTVPLDEAQAVFHESLVNDIGVRGSNIFTLTYRLVSGYFSLAMTFFIICVQYGMPLEEQKMQNKTVEIFSHDG